MRFRLGTILRIALAAGLTAWVIDRSHPAAIAAALAQTSWPWVLAACALVVADRLLMAYRWIALLAPVGDRRPPLGTLVRIFLVTTFVGTFLPGSVGGDAARAWSLSRDGVPMSQSVASVLMDRLLGVVSLLLAAAVGLALVPDVLNQPWLVWPFAVTTAACALALAFVFSVRVDDLVRRALIQLPAGKVRTSLSQLLDALQAYRMVRGLVVGVLVASLAVQGLRILQAWLLGLSLHIEAPLIGYCAFIPIIVLVLQAPISISGLGVGQVAFEWCFARLGVAAAPAVALSVLFLALGIVGSLPGGLFYAAEPTRTAGTDLT